MVQISIIDAYETLKPLIFFIIGLAIYAIGAFNLYKFVAKRDIFELNLNKYNTLNHPIAFKFFASILYILEYLIFFPLFLVFWFILFSAMLLAITKNKDIGTIFFISMALISAIRISSYYKESLSKDIAKLLPFTLLGIFLIDTTSFSWDKSLELLRQMPDLFIPICYYLIFSAILEFFLRIGFTFKKLLKKD